MAASSEFARAELKKYGWNEGKGLGKHEDGITLAIKPKLKFDKHGLGHDSGLEYKCFWWAQAFNKAASNIIVKNSSDSSPIITERKKRNTKRKATNSKNTCYKNFVSAEFKSNCDYQSSKIEDADKNHTSKNIESKVGTKMNAKLARLQKQEESFAELFSTGINNNTNN